MKIAVVGNGIVGLSVAFSLRKSGHEVVVVGKEPVGSAQSIGDTRIFRLGHDDINMTKHAQKSLFLWRKWEHLAGRKFISQTGLALANPTQNTKQWLTQKGYLHRKYSKLGGIDVENMLIDASGAVGNIKSALDFLQTNQTMILEECIEISGSCVVTPTKEISVDHVFVCAGNDTYNLLGLPEPQLYRAIRFSFLSKNKDISLWPCWINRDKTFGPHFYALPDADNHYAIGKSVNPTIESISKTQQIKDEKQEMTKVVQKWLPDLCYEPNEKRTIVCNNHRVKDCTVDPNSVRKPGQSDGWTFIEQPRVTGITGHNLFKFAPLLGSFAAQKIKQTYGTKV